LTFYFFFVAGGGGGLLVFVIPMAWFEGELMFCLIYTFSCFLSHCFSPIYLIYLLLHLLY
jgi:hypothetical protein